MKITLMGTGTSHGVPVIGCKCPVCTSSAPKDKRNRASIFVSEPCSIVVDTGPEFRIQALKYGVKSLDAVLITHGHADHLNGLDDVRIFSHTKSAGHSEKKTEKDTETKGEGLPVYANARALADIRKRFDYIFTPTKEGGGKPKIQLCDCATYSLKNPLCIKGLSIVPVPIIHGSLNVSGWLFSQGSPRKSIAYLTDCSYIPEESIELLKSAGHIEHLVIDGLREEKHSTHFSFLEALQVAEKIRPRHTWLTHISHTRTHQEINALLAQYLTELPVLNDIVKEGGSVSAAWDSLVLEA